MLSAVSGQCGGHGWAGAAYRSGAEMVCLEMNFRMMPRMIAPKLPQIAPNCPQLAPKLPPPLVTVCGKQRWARWALCGMRASSSVS